MRFLTAALAATIALSSSSSSVNAQNNPMCGPETENIRTVDGSCNHRTLPGYRIGAADTFMIIGSEGQEEYVGPLLKDAPDFTPLKNYTQPNDGWLAGGSRPDPRIVSNTFAQRQPLPFGLYTDPEHSVYSISFGQFVLHDTTNNRQQFAHDNHVDTSTFQLRNFITNKNDPICTPKTNGPSTPCNDDQPILRILELHDSAFVMQANQMRIYNNNTAYLDLSNVYGSDALTAKTLRSFSKGRLVTGRLDTRLPGEDNGGPLNVGTPTNFGPPDATLPGVKIALDNQLPNCDLFHRAGIDQDEALVGPPSLQSQFSCSGDDRTMENSALTLHHLTFMREHNKIADRLASENPGLSDEIIFQKARAINTAKYQHVIFSQYLPTEFGQQITQTLMGPYTGYQEQTNPGVSSAFASAAFRFGHYTMNPWSAVDECGAFNRNGQTFPRMSIMLAGGVQPVPAIEPFLAQAFVGQTAPIPFLTSVATLANAGGKWENIIRGIIATPTALPTNGAPDQLRSIDVAAGSGAPPSILDLVSFDISRGRRNRLPNYSKMRSVYHYDKSKQDLKKATGCVRGAVYDSIECFKAITSNPETATKLRTMYKKFDNIDALVGLIHEDPVQGSSYSATLNGIVIDQYRRLRDGDRFYWENPENWCTVPSKNKYAPAITRDWRTTNCLTNADLAEIRSTTMGVLLRRNFESKRPTVDFPENPFKWAGTQYYTDLAAGCATPAPAVVGTLEAEVAADDVNIPTDAESTTSTTTSTVNLPVVIGVTVGGSVLLLAIIAIAITYRRRQAQKSTVQSVATEFQPNPVVQQQL